MRSYLELEMSMRLKHAKTLITGIPGVGKTTLVQKIIEQADPLKITGFVTTEIRFRGSRQGFELHGLNGTRRILSHVNIQSRHRVGKYGVDTDGFEDFLSSLDLLNPKIELIVIDEIGKMELFSVRFQNLVHAVFYTDKQVLATVPLKSNAFIRDIKKRPDVYIFELTRTNRDCLLEAILE